jgi:hypothetical protein
MDLLVCGVEAHCIAYAFAILGGSVTFVLIYDFSLLTQLVEV